MWWKVTGQRTEIRKQHLDTSLRNLLDNQVNSYMYKSGTYSISLLDSQTAPTQVTGRESGVEVGREQCPGDTCVSVGRQEADRHFQDAFTASSDT